VSCIGMGSPTPHEDLRFDLQRVTLHSAHALRRSRSPSSWIIGLGDLPPRLMPWALTVIWSISMMRLLTP
jgi:hypothetical protein